LITESITGGAAAISDASLLAVEVRVGLIEGALATVAGVFGGAVVVAEVELVDLIVIEEEDIIGAERVANVTGVVESCVVVGVGVDLILMLVEAAVESELNLTELVVKVEDLVNVVMMGLGLAMGEEVEVVFVRGVNDWVKAVVGTATEEGFAIAAVLTEVVVSGEEMVGLEKRDVNDGVTSLTPKLMAVLAFPHSASTSAIMSPPPEIESKVRREEMSASKELRLLSPGIKGGSEAGKGGKSLVLLTLPAVTWGVVVFDGDVGALSCVVLIGLQLSFSGLSGDRG